MARNSPTRRQTKPSRTGYIIGPVVDSLFIIGAPLLALCIGAPLFSLPRNLFEVTIAGQPTDLRSLFVATFTFAHLALVFVRSHANQNIFFTFPLRFTLVPLAVFLGTVFSPHFCALATCVAVWWDVYHSSLQTFGFGRIYDAKKSNPPLAGRRLDYWMNLYFYLGPVLAGAHFIAHLETSRSGFLNLKMTGDVMSHFLYQRTNPLEMGPLQWYLTWGVLASGIPFCVFYLISYARLARAGYAVSWQKVFLLGIAAFVSIFCWGFGSFIDAFWVMNVFHALQYFVIVLYTENANLKRLFRVENLPYGSCLAAFYVILVTFLYGLWASAFASGNWMIGSTLTVGLMHFWFDSFIWSVRKKQV